MRQIARTSGFTLIEVLIAVSLVSLLSVAMLVAIRVALNSEVKANTKLLANRRVVGAQRALEQEVEGFMPEVASWTDPNGGGTRYLPFFAGEPQSMRFVSSYSLSGANRGTPQLLEYLVLTGEPGQGVRLIVNEVPYRGSFSAGSRIAGMEADANGVFHAVFFPIQPGPSSFVLADRLAYCRMLYLEQEQNPPRREWRAEWVKRQWPVAVRFEMAPIEGDSSLLHPMTVTAPLRAFRDPDKTYRDEPGFK